MKPKYQKIIRQLPLAIFIAGSMTAQGAIFMDDTAGNAQPTGADSGANSILADGGTSATPFVIIGSDVDMTGSVVPLTTYVLSLSGAFPYTVTVASGGSLAGSASHDGIVSTVAFTLTNDGTISGSGGALFQAIETVGGATALKNNSGGTISSGSADAILFTTAGGSVSNAGSISALAGALTDGVHGTTGVSVTNTGNGTIGGSDDGVEVTSGLTLTNGAVLNAGTPVINGVAGNGIFATSGANITNFGGITGFVDGINVTSGATINNNTSDDSDGDPFAGGTINGGAGNHGVNATDTLTLTNQNLSTITGGLDGVHALDNAIVNNNFGGTITGTTGTGVWLDDFAGVTNGGTITGTAMGLRISDNSTVTNTNLISGLVGIDAFAGVGSTFTLNNSGLFDVNGIAEIRSTGVGGTAIDGVLGADTLNLGALAPGFSDSGSLVTGNILLNSGNDNVFMTAGAVSDQGSVVNGNINGGTGTDTLTFTGGAGFDTGSDNIVNGNVTFMQDIIKNGSGVAFIGIGDILNPLRTVQTDAIHVNSGALYINGNIDAATTPATTISVNAASIGGTGTWGNAIENTNISLTNGAGISPGAAPISVAGRVPISSLFGLPAATGNVVDAVGSVTIVGDVTLDGTSFYRWDVAPDVDPAFDTDPPFDVVFDQIVLSGPGSVFAVNGDEFRISPTDVNAPIQDGARIVVDTDSTLVGSFGSITLSPFVDNTPDNGPFFANEIDPIIANFFSTLTTVNADQDWQLTITHDYSMFGSTPNEVAAGNMLDALVPTATGDIADLLAALDYSDASVTEAVLAALDPTSYFATASALASNNYRLHRAVETHNALVRASSGTTLSSSGGTYSGGKGGVMSSTFSGCGSMNAWGSVSYDWQEYDAENSDFDSDGETGSFTAGIDFTIANNFRLGLVAEGSKSDWDGDDSGNGSDIDSYRFGLYANWGEATGWFVDALVGYNSHSIDQDRYVGLGGIGGPDSFTNDYDADGWQGFVNVGHAFETGAGLISPFIGVEWQQLDVDGFSEDSFAGLDDYQVDSLRGLAGVKWEMVIGGSSSLYATAAYAHEFEDSTEDVTVSFGGGSYEAEGLDQGDSVLLSAGLRWSVTDCTTIDFGYRGELGLDDNGIDSHGASVGANFAF